jgi:hypothetical protein
VRYPPEHVFDACMTQLNMGKDLETVLSSVPEHADELRPMLAAVAWMKMEIPAPTSDRRRAGKQDFMATVAKLRREVESTQGLINEIKAGVALDEVLLHAMPEQTPLVVAAWRMYATPAPAPDAKRIAAGKAQLMAMVAVKRSERERLLAASMSTSTHLRAGVAGLARGMTRGLSPRPSFLRRAVTGVAGTAIAAIVLAVGSAGVGTAAADSLPGETFYGMKRLGESARMLFAFDPARRAELDTVFNRARLDEMIVLAENGRHVPADVLGEWAGEQCNAYAAIRRLPLEAQEALGDALLEAFGSARAAAEALRAAADDGAIEGLVAWLSDRDPSIAVTTLEPAFITPGPVLDRASRPIERPMPAEDRESAPGEDLPFEELAPITQPVVGELEDTPEGEVDFLLPQISEEDDDDDGDGDGNGEHAAAAGPGADPVDPVDPADEPVDAGFVKPPMEEPSPEPIVPIEPPSQP